MSPDGRVEIVRELPNGFRSQAAELLYEAFHKKMKVLIGEEAKALRIIQAAADFNTGFYATHKDRLAGIAGIQSKGNKYFNVKLSSLLQEFDFFGALSRLIRFKLESMSSVEEGELEIVALSVRSEMRGKGIGTLMISKIIEHAEENGFEGITLTVVDTNQDAKRLYERMGFSVTRIRRYGRITRPAGFEAVIHMHKELAACS